MYINLFIIFSGGGGRRKGFERVAERPPPTVEFGRVEQWNITVADALASSP